MTWEIHNSEKCIKEYTKFHEIAHMFCNDTNTHKEDTVKVGEETLLCVDRPE